jgi:glutamate/tyrosine decarboxylase-like PLP-dependent enzyme
VAADPRFEVMAPAHFGLVCFRLNDGRGEAELAALNKALMDRLNATGRAYFTHTVLHGKFTLRMVIGQRTTRERHVRAAWALIQETAAGLEVKPSA